MANRYDYQCAVCGGYKKIRICHFYVEGDPNTWSDRTEDWGYYPVANEKELERFCEQCGIVYTNPQLL